ncbi:MAG: hypothetical protein HN348_36665, partial [Proteobacteria bacterium]|nr:hypothetical protein [Pseudomonadota bacterium]
MASQRAALRNIVVVAVLFGLFLVIGIAFRFLIYPMLREDLVAGTSSESKYLHEVTIRLDS